MTLPEILQMIQDNPWTDFIVLGVTVGGAVVLGSALSALTRGVLRSAARRKEIHDVTEAVGRLRGPFRILFPTLVVVMILPVIPLDQIIRARTLYLARIILTAIGIWLVFRVLSIVENEILKRYDVSVPDNLKARRAHTQIKVIGRIIGTIALLLGISAVLMTFEPVRQLGTTLLASAGVFGIIIGFAAQKTIGLVVAGLQVAFAQPIRLDDVVVVEGEWGRVEEITLTYVVVRIWDRRRLILPVTYFIEHPFQNWTRVSADLLGSVFLYVDYSFPVDQLRNRLKDILEESSLWNRDVWVLQVTDVKERTLELRALMTASDSPALWDLRCEVREKLIAWIRDTCPEYLPRVRARLEQERPGLTESPSKEM
jgi:small-conductance mechanosensitive channel